MNDLFGTSPIKLVRRDDPDTSFEAAEKVDTTRLEALVYETIAAYGEAGCIIDDVRARFLRFPYSSITARPSALIAKGLVEDTGKRRPGNSGRNQRVMRITGKSPWPKK
jgi:hypothetical protein